MSSEFDIDPERDPADEHARDALIDSMARQVVARRLETPALFVLEAHRPLSVMAGQALYVGAPLLGVFFGFSKVQQWARLLEDRDNIDRIIKRIEELSDRHAASVEAREGRTS
jgi:hypothetical protein